jgi:GTPase
VETAHGVVVGRLAQKLRSPSPAHYIGKGKLQELIAARASTGYTVAVFDDELTPSQQRNLENALEVKVLDRTALILDIFAMRARTKEGRLQVDLAQSEYLLPRLAGQWSHLERLGGSGRQGSIGVRGPGETQLETDRRLVRNKITRLKDEIEAVRRQRTLYRRRRARSAIPLVALVGYTNAGKSTLMSALSRSEVFVEDQLFATLDPLTRRIHLPNNETVLLTDTVGFIQKLPTELIAAFRATLEELAEADLLVHVIDITHPNAAQQSQVVDNTLLELGLQEKPLVAVLNKVDLLRASDGAAMRGVHELDEVPSAAGVSGPGLIFVSAKKGWGLEKLADEIWQVAMVPAASKT